MKGRIVPVLLLTLLLMGASARTVSAQSRQIRDLSEKRVTISLKETDVRTALLLLFAGSGVQYVVDDGVPNIVVSGELSDKPFHVALQWLMTKVLKDGARLQYGFGTEAFFLVPNPNTAEEAKKNPGAKRKVELSLKQMPLRRSLELIFFGSGLQFAVDPKVPNLPVTVDLNSVTIEQALPMLVAATSKQARLAITLEGDVYVVRTVD